MDKILRDLEETDIRFRPLLEKTVKRAWSALGEGGFVAIHNKVSYIATSGGLTRPWKSSFGKSIKVSAATVELLNLQRESGEPPTYVAWDGYRTHVLWCPSAVIVIGFHNPRPRITYCSEGHVRACEASYIADNEISYKIQQGHMRSLIPHLSWSTRATYVRDHKLRAEQFRKRFREVGYYRAGPDVYYKNFLIYTENVSRWCAVSPVLPEYQFKSLFRKAISQTTHLIDKGVYPEWIK